jgi:hypothetical protein
MIAACLLMLAGEAEALDVRKVAEEVEREFRAAMTAWAYDQQWTLWEMGAASERARISQSRFTERLRQGGGKPAAGRQVDFLEIRVHSATSATVTAGFGLEVRTSAEVTNEYVTFPMRLEEGRWRIPLVQIAQLAESRSYRSPPQPLVIPAPSPFRR